MMVYFISSVKLVENSYCNNIITPEDIGCVQWLLVEPHCIASVEMETPDGAEWKYMEVTERMS